MATAAVALLLAAGCGGDSEGSAGEVSVETGSLSKAEFIKRADEICAEGREQYLAEFVALEQKGKPATSKAAQEALVTEIVEDLILPNYEKRIEEISTLGAPEEFQDEVASFLEALQESLDKMEAQPLKVSESGRPFVKPIKLAETYGLKGCAESFV